MSEQESATAEREREIRGAVARGWCADKNRFKEMDVDLAEAISQEVAAYCASRERAAEHRGHNEIIFAVLDELGYRVPPDEAVGMGRIQREITRVVQQAVEAERERCATEMYRAHMFVNVGPPPRCEYLGFDHKAAAGHIRALPATVSPGTVESPMESLVEANGQALEQDQHRDDYVAWLRFVRVLGKLTNIVLCDSDAPGAFKVYRRSAPDSASTPAGLLELARKREGKLRAELRLAYHVLHNSRDHHGYFKTCTQASCVANRTVLEMK